MMRIRKRWNPRNLTVFLSVVMLTLVGVNIFAGLDPTEAAAKKTYVPVIVHEGDNLWNLASRSVPSQDPRKTIQEIIEVNNLSGSYIYPGQVIEVPTNSVY